MSDAGVRRIRRLVRNGWNDESKGAEEIKPIDPIANHYCTGRKEGGKGLILEEKSD